MGVIIESTVEKEVGRSCCEEENKPEHANQKGFLKGEQREIFNGIVQRERGVHEELQLLQFHESNTMS